MTKPKKMHPTVWVRHFRKLRGLTAQQLADAVGLTREQITNIETSIRGLTLENAKRIADVLEVHYTDIIDGPAEHSVAKNETQRKILAALDGLSDREQALYANAFLNGLAAQKAAESPHHETSPKKTVTVPQTADKRK